MNQEKTGKFIAESRKNKNLTQEQLAEILGVNNRTISRWENGKNMPDISLFKMLCKTLDISVEELINGEPTNKKNITKSYEKAIISTIKLSNKTKNKMNKIVKILLLIIIITLIITSSIIIYYNNKYPKIDIYNIKPIISNNNQLNKKITLDKNTKIYLYGIDSIQLSDSKNNYFDLKTALKYNQINTKDIKKYLKNQTANNNIEKYLLNDGKDIIYKAKKYEIILCENNNIYFGLPNLETKLKGLYCDKKEETICTFTKTYYIKSIQEDDDENFINVTLKQYQGPVTIVRINKNNNIQVGNAYEFKFNTYETFEPTINNIFKYSKIVEITKTNKIGLEQVNENICITK